MVRRTVHHVWRISLAALTAILLPFVALAPSYIRTATIQAQSTVAWLTMSPLPAPSEGMAALRMPDGTIVALGGDAVIGAQARMAVRLDRASGLWRRLPDAPITIDTPAAVALDNRTILAVAPSFASGSVAAPSRALLLDVTARRWTALPPCPVPLLAPHLLRMNARTVLASGGAGFHIGASFDLISRRWTPLAAPFPNLATYSIAALRTHQALLMASVAINAHGRPSAVQRAWILVGSHTWHQVARPPLPVDGAQAVTLGDGRVLIAGGYPLGDAPGQIAPPTLLYDSHLDQWSVAGSTGNDQRGGQLVFLGGNRAVLVGGHGPGGQPGTGVLLYNDGAWQALRPLPGSWGGYALVATADGSLLLIGGDQPSGTGFAPAARTLLLPTIPVVG